MLRIDVNLFDKNNITKSKDANFSEDFFLMKPIVKRSLPHVEGFNDPPNFGDVLIRHFDNFLEIEKCFANSFKTKRCFGVLSESFE